MADQAIDGASIHLFDRWPGPIVSSASGFDYGEFTDATVHNVTAPAVRVGTKRRIQFPAIVLPSASPAGYATLIYLKLLPKTEPNPTCAARQVVVPVAAGDIYTVTNDPDQCLVSDGCPFAAVMLSVMTPTFATAAVYGWFWCGGDCPVAAVADLDGTYLTVNTVTACNQIMTSNLAADSMGFALVTGVLPAIGWAEIADS
jgi:hypothetical protein